MIIRINSGDEKDVEYLNILEFEKLVYFIPFINRKKRAIESLWGRCSG